MDEHDSWPAAIPDPHALASLQTRLLAAVDVAATPAALAAVLARAETYRRPDVGESWWRAVADAAFEKHVLLIAEAAQPLSERLEALLALATSVQADAAGASLVLDLALDLAEGAQLLPFIELACQAEAPALADQAKLLWHRAIATADRPALSLIAETARRLGWDAFAELAAARNC